MRLTAKNSSDFKADRKLRPSKHQIEVEMLLKGVRRYAAPAEGFMAGIQQSLLLKHTPKSALENPELNLGSDAKTEKLNVCQALY